MFWFLLTVVGLLAGLYFFKTQMLLDFVLILARWLTGFKRKTIYVDGTLWYYLEGGNKDAAPMVLVHGFALNKESWLPYARLFTGKYRVIVPDLPGFGEAEGRVDKDYTSPAQVRRLHNFLKALGVTHCHLTGNSMGGLIAAHYTLEYQDQIDSLALIASYGIDTLTVTPFAESVSVGKTSLVASSREEFEQLTALVTHKAVKVPKRIFQTICDDSLRRAPVLESIFKSFFEAEREFSLNDQLQQIKVPTLVLWGRQDQLLDASAVGVLKQGIPHCHTVVLESTGHIPMVERPGDTARHHFHFLETEVNYLL